MTKATGLVGWCINTVWVLGVTLFGNGVQVVGAVLQVCRPLWDTRGMKRKSRQNGDSKGCVCVSVCTYSAEQDCILGGVVGHAEHWEL